MSRQRYTTTETHGSATATRNGQQAEVVCLLFFICGAACTAHEAAVYVPNLFFTFFLLNKNWASAWRLTAETICGRPTSERLARQTRARPQRVSVVGRAGESLFPFLFYFWNRSIGDKRRQDRTRYRLITCLEHQHAEELDRFVSPLRNKQKQWE
jgi:hypothetical protein